MRQYFSEMAGNRSLLRRLAGELSQGSFSHAYIIEGADGFGKHTLARNMVMALACQHRGDADYPLPCGTCAACRKIAAGISPDVTLVKRPDGKSMITVDTVRDLRADVAVFPNDLDFKVYIIEDAHTMNTQAQNAFLLTLEEPPPFVLFLLLAEDAGALLETIRSRAPVLRMQPIAEDEMRAYLLSPERTPKLSRAAITLAEQAPDDLAALISASGGSIGKALELLDDKRREPMLEARRFVSEACTLLAARTRNDELLAALLSLGTNRDEVAEHFRLWQIALRDLLALDLCEDAPLLFFTDRQAALALSERFTATRLLATVGALDKAIEALGDKANLRLTLAVLMTDLKA